MIRHLTPDEQVDLLEGTLPRERASHADECDECTVVRRTLAAALEEARAERVPEPSPLFWAHQSERIRRRIADEPPARTSPPWRMMAWTTALSTGLAVGVFIVRPHAPADRQEIRSAPSAASAIVLTHDGDEHAWALVELAGDDADAEAVAAAVAPASGAAERAVQDLTDAERSSLTNLLQQELKDRKE